MTHFNWRSAALVSLTSFVFTAFAIAQEASNTSQGKSGGSQASSSNSSSQGQSNASNSSNANSNRNDSTSNTSNKQSDNSTNTQSGNAQSKDSSSSQNQSKQVQSNQNRGDRSSRDSASDRSSSNTQRGQNERDSANSDRDNRGTSRDRSSRDADRNVENRSSNSERDSSREHSSRRENMRGPDIGIWFSRSSRDGLVISDVSSRGAIAKLGFREGDRIVSIDGRRVTREEDFIQYLLRGGSRRVVVIVLRDNREETIYVEPAVLIDNTEYVEVDPLERFGIILDDRYDDRIVVWRVIPRSQAYYAGFRPGDVIVTFSGRPYRTRTEFERGSRDWKTGEANVQIRRGERTRELSVEIPNKDASDRRTSERSENRDERTAQRDTSVTPDQGSTPNTTNRTDRNTNDQRNNNNRGGILNGVGRGRGNR
jgi:C-terminal processing protease CtpA/Prc